MSEKGDSVKEISRDVLLKHLLALGGIEKGEER